MGQSGLEKLNRTGMRKAVALPQHSASWRRLGEGGSGGASCGRGQPGAEKRGIGQQAADVITPQPHLNPRTQAARALCPRGGRWGGWGGSVLFLKC